MALTPEQAAAYERLEDAVSALVAAFPVEDGDEPFTTGFVILINRGQAVNDPDRDELAMMDFTSHFTRRGQSPALTRGIAENWLDSWRNQ